LDFRSEIGVHIFGAHLLSARRGRTRRETRFFRKQKSPETLPGFGAFWCHHSKSTSPGTGALGGIPLRRAAVRTQTGGLPLDGCLSGGFGGELGECESHCYSCYDTPSGVVL
jgi:hypothetical protein